MSDAPDDWMTESDAATHFAWSRQQIEKLKKKGILPFALVKGKPRITVADLRGAPVLLPGKLLELAKASRETLAVALMQGLVRAVAGKYTLNDAAAIRALQEAPATAPSTSPHPESAPGTPPAETGAQAAPAPPRDDDSLLRVSPDVAPAASAPKSAKREDGAERGRQLDEWRGPMFHDDLLDDLFAPTIDVDKRLFAPPELFRGVPADWTLKQWFVGRLRLSSEGDMTLTLVSMGDGKRNLLVTAPRRLRRPLTADEWRRFASLEAHHGAFVFYAVYRDAADPKNDPVRIIPQVAQSTPGTQGPDKRAG